MQGKSVCVCVCLIFEMRSSSGHTSVRWWWSLGCTRTPLKIIYPSQANRHNVLHISYQHLMHKRLVLCVPRHSTVKPRGEPFSPAPALIQQTWCAQILITSAHMCTLLHHANDTRHVPHCCSHLLLPEKTKACAGAARALGQRSAKRTKCVHMDAHRADLGDWQER